MAGTEGKGVSADCRGLPLAMSGGTSVVVGCCDALVDVLFVDVGCPTVCRCCCFDFEDL